MPNNLVFKIHELYAMYKSVTIVQWSTFAHCYASDTELHIYKRVDLNGWMLERKENYL